MNESDFSVKVIMFKLRLKMLLNRYNIEGKLVQELNIDIEKHSNIGDDSFHVEISIFGLTGTGLFYDKDNLREMFQNYYNLLEDYLKENWWYYV